MYHFQASVFSFIVGSWGGGRRVDFGIGCSRPKIRMLRRKERKQRVGDDSVTPEMQVKYQH